MSSFGNFHDFPCRQTFSRKTLFFLTRQETRRGISKNDLFSERVKRSGRNRVHSVRNRKMEPFGLISNYLGRIFSRSGDIHEKPISPRIIVAWWVEASKSTLVPTSAKFKFLEIRKNSRTHHLIRTRQARIVRR